jgi:tripartite-type tricarboxylate transporter receptor subunit TctC
MRAMFGALALLGLLAANPGMSPAAAQSYPSRNVTFIVTTTPGGLTDVLARAFGQRLSQMWGQPIVIENRAGAAYALAANAVKSAAPDGYTLLVTETGMFTIQPFLAKDKPSYDLGKDFQPVGGLASIPMALIVNPSVPAKSVRELITLAKEKPGTVNYGTPGAGTAPHMGALLLANLSGVTLTSVHYRGVSLALNDVIAGHINMITMGPSIALPSVRAGKLNVLGLGSSQRIAQLPDIPTVAETVPGYSASVSFGLFAPAGTPREIVAKINADMQQIAGDQEFRARVFEPQVLQPLPGSPDAFGKYIGDEAAKWSKVISDTKLQVE